MFRWLVVILLVLVFIRGWNQWFSAKGSSLTPIRDDQEGSSQKAVGESRPSVTVYLPENFPSDLPVYPEAQFQGKNETGLDSGFVTFWVNSPPQQITKYYEEALEKNGWVVEAQSHDENGSSFSVSKDDVASTVGIRMAGGKTLLSITFGPE